MRFNGRTALIGSLAALMLAGCTHRLIDFTVISSKNVDLSRMSTFKRGTSRPTGEDKAYLILFIPTGIPQVKEAVDRSLQQVPGAVALVDGVVYYHQMWFILFGWNSYIVEGTPLIDPTLIKAGEARPSDYMVSYQDPATKAQKLAYVSQEEYAQVKQAIRSNDGAKVQSILAAH